MGQTVNKWNVGVGVLDDPQEGFKIVVNEGATVREEVAMTKVNKSLIKKRRKRMDIGLLVTILILLSLGLIMVLSASAPSALTYEGDSYFYFKSQLVNACIGIAAMLFFSIVDYRLYNLGKIPLIALCIALGLLVLVLVPGVGVTVNGATRWIKLGIMFQPSEIMKIALIVFLASRLSKDPKNNKKFWKGIFPNLIVVGVVCLLLYKEPHYSAIGIIGIVSAIMIFISGMRLMQIIVAAPPILLVGIFYLLQDKYRVERITSFLNPWSDLLDTGWQAVQSLYAVGSGGLFGVGLGNSTQKYMYIPEPHNDFIFAIWSEEAGFIGAVAVIILFGIFIWRGITIAMKAPDMFGTLLAIGITSLVAVQALLNIAIVSALFPVTGIPLPFFSYGGTALIILLSSCGVLLNISRNSVK